MLLLRIGDVLCTPDEETWPIEARWSRKHFTCRLPQDELVQAGRYNVSMRQLPLNPTDGSCPNVHCIPFSGDAHGFGFANVILSETNWQIGRLERQWPGFVDLTTAAKYHFEVYPEIHNASPSVTGIHGGSDLTIMGSGFSTLPADNVVTVGGVPCAVMSSTPSRLVCRLGSRAAFAGGSDGTLRGLQFNSYRDSRGRAYDCLADSLPDASVRTGLYQSGTVKSQIDWTFRTEAGTNNLDGNDDQYLREFVGFFVPPVTANYSFYIAGDDKMSVEIGTDESYASLRRVASARSWTPLSTGAEVGPVTWYRWSDERGPDYAVSEDIYLASGSRYAFRLRHTAYGGAEWVRFGLRVAGLRSLAALPEPTAAALAETVPAMELQRLTLRTTAVREQHFLEVGNVAGGGDFMLRLSTPTGLEAFVRLNADVTAEDVAAKIKEAAYRIPGQEPIPLIDCSSVTAVATSEGTSRTFVVTLACPLAVGSDRHLTITVEDSFQTAVRTGLAQNASLPVSGTFRVGHSGLWSEPIDVRTRSWQYLSTSISAVRREASDVEPAVELEAWPSIAGWSEVTTDNVGFEVWVRFRRPLGDVAPLEVDAEEVQGELFDFTVDTIEEGNADAVMLDKVSAAMFEMPLPENEEDSSIRVVTRGVLAGSKSATPPAFGYRAELTPVLLSVSPSLVRQGAALTLDIENLDASEDDIVKDVEIRVGDAPCVLLPGQTASQLGNRTANITSLWSLTCTVGPGAAGEHRVSVRSMMQGLADPAMAPTVTYEPTISAFGPPRGSLAGSLVEIVGGGLRGLPCSAVLLGGIACLPPEVHGHFVATDANASVEDDDVLHCLTPPAAGVDLGAAVDAWPSEVVVDVTVTVPAPQAGTVRGTFVYDAALTPAVSSVTPSAKSSALSGTITMSGINLTDGSTRPLVFIDNRPCILSTFAAEEISCWVQRSEPGEVVVRRPIVWVPDLGLAAIGDAAQLTLHFEVHSVSPPLASLAGGSILSVRGAGFHPVDPTMQQVTVVLANGMRLPCAVLSGDAELVRCQVQGASPRASAKGRRLLAAAAGRESPGIAHQRCENGAADASRRHCFARALLGTGGLRAPHGSHHVSTMSALAALADPWSEHHLHHISAEALDLVEDDAAAEEALVRRLSGEFDDNSSEVSDGGMFDSEDAWDMSATVSVSLNGLLARCARLDSEANADNATNCDFALSEAATPHLLRVDPRRGSYALGTEVVLLVGGMDSSTSPQSIRVYFGPYECPVSSVGDHEDSSNVTRIVVPVCPFPATSVPIRVYVDPIGYAVGASPYGGSSTMFTQELILQNMTPSSGSLYGGVELSLKGAGFGQSLEANRVVVGDALCRPTSATVDELRCYTPVQPTGAPGDIEVVLQVLTPIAVDAWTIGPVFSTCAGSAFDADGSAAPQPEAEPEPEPEPEPEGEPEPAPGQSFDGLLASSGFTFTGLDGIRMHKADCPSASGSAGDAEVYVPDDADAIAINFKIELGCETRCSPLRLTLVDRDAPENVFRWCFNWRDGGECDAKEEVGEQIWHSRTFVVDSFAQKHSYSPARLTLRLGVFAFEAAATTLISSAAFREQIGAGAFKYSSMEASPQVTGFTQQKANGVDEVLLTGVNFGSVEGLVTLGTAPEPDANFACAVSSWNDTAVRCDVPSALPAGAWLLRTWTPSYGWSSPAPALVWIEATVESLEAASEEWQWPAAAAPPWTLVMKIAGGPTLGYNSPLWTNDETLNDNSPPTETANAKYAEFNSVAFKRIRFCISAPRGNCIEHEFGTEWTSARALFSAGPIPDEAIDQARLLQTLLAPAGAHTECPMMQPGFNVECGTHRVRFGFCSGCPTRACGASSDAAVGVGLRDGAVNLDMGAGWTSLFAPGAGACYPAAAAWRNVWIWVENQAFPSGANPLPSGFGGGLPLALRGAHFGHQPSDMQVWVCDEPCRVTSTDPVNGSTVVCETPMRRTLEMAEVAPNAYPVVDLAAVAARFYTDRGVSEASIAQLAFTSAVDQGVSLYMNGQWNNRQNCWLGFELPVHKRARLATVDIFPPTNPLRRKYMEKSIFQVRNLTGSTEWITVASLENAVQTGASIAQGWTSFSMDESLWAQAFRIKIMPDGCRLRGELLRGVRFRGQLFDANDASTCSVQLGRILHPLASLPGGFLEAPSSLEHSTSRSPVLEALAPRQGSIRGGTEVTLRGTGLQPLGHDGSPLDAAAQPGAVAVTLNGYACAVVAANDTEVRCITGERDNGITEPSTEVWVAGRGRALLAGQIAAHTTFQYIDKWSDVHSWLHSEPPVDGDSVIVPLGQSILLDKDSPKLFFVLVSGLLQFDRRDISFDATYIWISGGHFSVGTEEEPFLHKATITLHGDRWWTIELPFIGAKNLVVTNNGGYHGGCHTESLRHDGQAATPCHVRSVGKLDLHGRPGVSWTRLVRTADAGTSMLHLEEAVAWEAGDRILITPSWNGQEEEVHILKEVHDGGFVVELETELDHTHLGEWYHHEAVSQPTDLRAAVACLTRNVRLQGDESSLQPGNSFMFGAHMATFFGGEMRVENVELTRTGQSANFGRYSSHWHNLSPGRTVDVMDKAYLRNNSYHDTFQRAVVVHGTDYCTVRDNIAHRTKGHSYFTESGDEHYPLFQHNLAVNPQPHPLLLDDDMDPAGFWLPGFNGWHRNNLAANCVRGWRVRSITSGVAAQQTDLSFFNNSAHACGFGWHLKPPHAPPTLNVFKSFTAFRCSTGMFYYGTGNIQHEDHRFIECGTGHFQNHLSNGLWQPPFYTNLVLVGNLDAHAGYSKSGLGIRTPKDSEMFFVSGMKAINYFNTPVLYGCFKTTCTMRFERCEWYNTTARTVSTPLKSGIYWDLDGTLTGYPNGFVAYDFEYLHLPSVGSGACHWGTPEHQNGVVCGASDGSLRLRRLLADKQQPWQLDGKGMKVISDGGEDIVPFDWDGWYGWSVPVVQGESFDLRPDVANDFRDITLSYGVPDLVWKEFGWNFTQVQPRDEWVKVHMNFTSWRDHYDASAGEALSREPRPSDPFGSHAVLLRKESCDLYNLTEEGRAVCDGNYHTDFGWDLKWELEEHLPRLPEPDGRLTMILSANQSTRTPWSLKQRLIAHECPHEGCPTTTVTTSSAPDPDSIEYRPWSDPAGWPNGKVPQEDENVNIEAWDYVMVDIETPKLYWVTVWGNGRLKFSREHNSTLNVHAMKVWGHVDMGTEEDPIPAGVKAEIVLHGEETDHTVVMTEGLYLENNVIAVLGSLSLAGSPLGSEGSENSGARRLGAAAGTLSWTKLAATAEAGASELQVRGDVSAWPAGARIALSATEFPQPPEETETEERSLLTRPTFDADSNMSTLRVDAPLEHRHFSGVVGSEDGHWPAPRLAAAVALLGGRSNVVVRSATLGSPHGGGIVVGGSQDGTMIGSAMITNVDFIGMGKFFFQYPALYFLMLGDSIGKMPPSRVEGCTFSYSQSGAIEANGASNLDIIGNVFHRTYRTALWITQESVPESIRVISNVAIETLRHPREATSWFRPFAAFFLEVPVAELSGNLAAGSTDGGFVIRPRLQTCAAGDVGLAPLSEVDMNEAVACVTGFFMLRACKGFCNTCALLRGAVAWKNAHIGVVTVDQSTGVRLDTVLVADNHIGISLNFHRGIADLVHRSFAHNITVLGSTSASTCSASTACRAMSMNDKVGVSCGSVVGSAFRRVGILATMINNKPKLCETNPKLKGCRPPNTPVKDCAMPWEMRAGVNGGRYHEGQWSTITFGHFKGDDCGHKSVAFTVNPTSKDLSFPHRFAKVQWHSVDPEAKLFLDAYAGMSPDVDGVLQLALYDVDGSLLGASQGGGTAIAAANPQLAKTSCAAKEGYYACDSVTYRMLRWEAVDSVSHRTLSKFKSWRASDNRATWSTGNFKEECLMGDARHERVWQTVGQDQYNLTMFTSPPKHHRLFFFNEKPEKLRVDIFLTQPFQLEVYVDGKQLSDAAYDTGKRAEPRHPALSDPHGTYAFDPHQRRFYLILQGGRHDGRTATEGGGFVLLRLIQVVQMTLSMAMPVAEFDGEKIVQNIATLLQIDPRRIKVVSVQSRAQVAAAGGRRLQEATELIVNILEENPEPIPDGAFSDAMPQNDTDAEEPWIDDSVTDSDENVSDANVSVAVVEEGGGFSLEAFEELKRLAEAIDSLASSGNLSSALGVPVTVDIVVSDPSIPMVEEPDTTTTTTTIPVSYKLQVILELVLELAPALASDDPCASRLALLQQDSTFLVHVEDAVIEGIGPTIQCSVSSSRLECMSERRLAEVRILSTSSQIRLQAVMMLQFNSEADVALASDVLLSDTFPAAVAVRLAAHPSIASAMVQDVAVDGHSEPVAAATAATAAITDDDDALSAGVIAAIVVGVLIGAPAIGFIVYLIGMRSRQTMTLVRSFSFSKQKVSNVLAADDSPRLPSPDKALTTKTNAWVAEN